MKQARLLHNSGAGSAGSYTKDQMCELFHGRDYKVSYASTKKDGWDKWDEEDDMIIVAGGDGTIRKTVKKLMQRKLIDKRFPIAVLPMGTANNIAHTFYHNTDIKSVINEWDKGETRHMDAVRVLGLEEENFFMEGFGVGVFPQLMREMKKQADDKKQNPKQELRTAQELLLDIVKTYKPKYCKLNIDGKDYSGKYYLIEVMNMQAIGPNLHLAPEADPSDGFLDVVMVNGDQQHKLAEYVRQKSSGNDVTINFPTVKACKVKLQWSGMHVHVDDKLIKAGKGRTITLELEKGLLEFFVDGKKITES